MTRIDKITLDPAERRAHLVSMPRNTPQERRLDRQFQALSRNIPALERPLRLLLGPRGWMIRMPAGVLLTIGGILSFLPVLGIWMLPLGLMLLAVDVPPLRPAVTTSMVRGRRRVMNVRRRFRRAPQAQDADE